MAKEKSGIFEKIEAEVINGAQDYVKGKIKKKIYRISEVSMLIVVGFILVSFGVALMMGSMYPVLANGYNFMILGILFLVVSFVLRV